MDVSKDSAVPDEALYLSSPVPVFVGGGHGATLLVVGKHHQVVRRFLHEADGTVISARQVLHRTTGVPTNGLGVTSDEHSAVFRQRIEIGSHSLLRHSGYHGDRVEGREAAQQRVRIGEEVGSSGTDRSRRTG
jgi:hypothetical protein